MKSKRIQDFERTTIWLPKRLHEEAKITAILAKTSFSTLLRSALVDKIKQLKSKVNIETNLSKEDS